MRLLIVEDERPIAEDLQFLVLKILGDLVTEVALETHLDGALQRPDLKAFDVVFLDLNLHGRDGFEVLKQVGACPFLTIVVSANTDRALEAFEYGVLDFVAKPYSEARLRKALDRLTEPLHQKEPRYLPVRHGAGLRLVAVDQLVYLQGADVYSVLHLRDGTQVDSEKTLARLEILLGAAFVRIHKSYLVRRAEIAGLDVAGGGRYHALLHNGRRLPVGRQRYKTLKVEWAGDATQP